MIPALNVSVGEFVYSYHLMVFFFVAGFFYKREYHESLDLKAAARAVGEKSIEMIPQARLLPLTGYVHGGCSPVGMKKPFPTVLDGSVEGLDAIVVSAGKIGAQVELAPAALCALVGGTFAPVSK